MSNYGGDAPNNAGIADVFADLLVRDLARGGAGDSLLLLALGDSLLLEFLSVDNDDSERCFFITCVSLGVLSLDRGRFCRSLGLLKDVDLYGGVLPRACRGCSYVSGGCCG